MLPLAGRRIPPIVVGGLRRPGDRMAGHRLLRRTVGPPCRFGHGRTVLLGAGSRRPIPPLQLDRPDRLPVFARLPAGPPADSTAALAGIHGRLGGNPDGCDGLPDRSEADPAGPRLLRPDGDLGRQHRDARRAGHRLGLPMAGDLVVRAADQDHAGHRVAVVRSPSRVALTGDRPRCYRAPSWRSRPLAARRVGPLGRGPEANAGKNGTWAAIPIPFVVRSRSRSSSSSGVPAPTVAGPCPSHRCWLSRRSGTAA